MFKGILPGKRMPSMEFTMVTPLGDSASNGKENQPHIVTIPSSPNKIKTSKSMFLDKTKHKKGAAPVAEPGEMNQAFDRLLDSLQIPSTLRPKLVGMESSVKAAMLKSSQALAVGVAPTSPPTSHSMRRVHSGSSISVDSLRSQRPSLDRYQTAGYAYGAALVDVVDSPTHPSRGLSLDLPRPKSRAQGAMVMMDTAAASKSLKDKGMMKTLSPVQFVSVLTGTSSLQLDVDIIKKLRLFLRNESANWSLDFLKAGGYSALLTRLNELLEVEWREEQHDDKVLHELLRCIKALSTSSIGCFALRSSCPTPFVQLVSLLYSDKKPGDVATRQLIVDLLLILFELYPPSALPSVACTPPRRSTWDQHTNTSQSSSAVSLPHPHKYLFSLLRALLLTPAPPSAEAPAASVSPHEFIDALHRPRIYKTYLQELSDICRDYFWVFCHPNNALWSLEDTDEAKVEKPRAPGGMTGGVEFEAMGYLTTHFRLVNAISKAAAGLDLPKEHELSAHQLHVDFFLSGIERIILASIARKASATYYPILHLELARYIALAAEANFELPWTVSRLIGAPPPTLCKQSMRGSPRTPTKKGAAGGSPILPSPRRIDSIRLD
ncbi:hypothetical protein EW146_g7046 [Bondarzewia mesenterica]|uniref:Formin GTPase-binding domain-containing protein n=1 Tax=Bondarzewia mesenterica TaxID=1095465 RepID=A0A4S4LNT4_9AGAM|nr:hypothetical protein EW146_g7046 [Bondarzewia mesenterica]